MYSNERGTYTGDKIVPIYQGLSVVVPRNKKVYVILPLPVKQDAKIRYLKIVDMNPVVYENNAPNIISVDAYNGFHIAAGYYPTWIPGHEKIHYVDLGDYYQFDKGLQIVLRLDNENPDNSPYIITGYGARMEW